MLFLAVLAFLVSSWAHAQPTAPATSASTPSQPAPSAALPPNPKVFDITRVRGGIDVPYHITFPPNYQPGPAYPVLIYFGDGTQDRHAVLSQLAHWEQEAAARRWVLVGIAKPGGNAQSLTTLPADAWRGVIEEIERVLPPADGKVALAGVGEGGRAALYLGGLVPEKVKAVLSLGAGAEDWFMGIAAGLKDVPVAMVVGEQDRAAIESSGKTAAMLLEANSKNAYQVLVRGGGAGEPLDASAWQVFELLSLIGSGQPPIIGAQPKAKPAAAPVSEADVVRGVLDDFHDAAAKADETRYFNHFAPGAVFLGTDAKERWTLEEFRAFAQPYFAKGKAWTYAPIEGGRFITIEGEHRDVAWFDEKLQNAKLGVCRGSGVLIKVGDVWKVKQYNLTMLVPNELAEEVAKKSRDLK